MSEFNDDLEQEEVESEEIVTLTSDDAEVTSCLELKDVPAIVQMEEMLKYLTSDNTPSKQKRLAQVCFTFLCSIVGDDIGVESDHDRNPSLWDQAAVKLIDAITSVPTKTYERDNFFAYLPEQKWPSFFQTYVDSISGKQPTEDFRNKYSKLSEEKLRLRYFGKHVLTTYLNTKKQVNNQWNPHWRKNILEKSGSSPSKVFYAIREYCYEKVIAEKARNQLFNAIKYRKGRSEKGHNIKKPIVFTATNTEEMQLEERANALREQQPFNSNEFDVAWPVFVLYGKPAAERAYNSFVGGNASSKQALTVDSIRRLKDSLPNKAARHCLDQSTPRSSRSSHASPSEHVVLLKRDSTDTTLNRCGGKVQALRMKIQVLGEMEERGIPFDRDELALTYRKLSEALDTQVNAFDDVN
mmetsp:Transcript_10293/g.15650  ORF Transcript_10293/g.15650 Transcript_10293/m.15650 type:complete len:411 (-) Transcript_10293:117-1349(-)|eukprot:CAMPEP_0185033614 /NCGR_PEP_ID=MMETSP1103-20130426/22707_1 /TAXON_ID=36769 /ORGANISM="Paraphysomonas bandaiensis, Strain Caron Lab Isolate" /LENGTH=410 /DNA_ID=CAMNT_0027569951 /DNA_START=30 /DNA_END=1262 /DNA_ORIENTATION=+